MKYAIISKEKCQSLGINLSYRMTHGDDVVITDKELNFSSAKGDSLDEKCQNEGIALVDADVVKQWDEQQRKEGNNE